jgi:UDP-N-acetyl-D-mannosaminuronate dehydrogenase
LIGYRRDQQNVDKLNAVPGNTIGATTDPAKIREADVVIIAVPAPVTRAKDPGPGPVVEVHRQFRQMPAEKIRSLMNDKPVLIDVRGMMDRDVVEMVKIYYRKP